MMDKKSGVATTIKNELNRNALSMHCHAHALNLTCGDSIKNCKLMQNALETSPEISKLVKKSVVSSSHFHSGSSSLTSSTLHRHQSSSFGNTEVRLSVSMGGATSISRHISLNE